MRFGANGQVTIPIAVRQQLGLHEGDQVEIVVDGTGRACTGRRARPAGQRSSSRLCAASFATG